MAADVGGGDSGHGKKAKKGRSKKSNPRIDMTPMVDLGFLLLTFFVLTTTMATPKTMPIVVPERKPDTEIDKDPPIAASKVLTLLLGKDNKVYWYHQTSDEQGAAPEIQSTGYGAEGIRKVILQRRKLIDQQWARPSDPAPSIILIKPTDDSNYGNLVDVLDEMTIIQQKKYMLVDVTPDELGMIEDYQKNSAAAPTASNQ